MSERPTPETEVEANKLYSPHGMIKPVSLVDADFARRLERQRDELAEALREAVTVMELHVDTRRCSVQSLRTMNTCRALLARIDGEKPK